MKILHVIPSLSKRDGGPTSVLIALVETSRALGHTVMVITSDKGVATEDRQSGVKYTRAYPPKRWTFSPGMIPVLHREMRNIDVVHVHSINTFPSLIAMWYARSRRIAFVVEPHGAMDPYHLGQRRLIKRLYAWLLEDKNLKRASAFIVSSEREAEGVFANYPDSHIRSIPLGVEASSFISEVPGDHQPQQVLFLGRLAEKKGVDILLDAWELIHQRRPLANLYLAGPLHHDLPGETRERIQSRLPNRVQWLGPVNSESRSRLLGESGVFVLASRDESFGVAVAEAMAAGLPVVITDEVGISPLVARTHSGLIVKRTARDIAAGLDKIFADESLRLRLGQNARQTAELNFRWTHVGAKFIDLYGDVQAERIETVVGRRKIAAADEMGAFADSSEPPIGHAP